jgi:hypothetical protein
MTDESFWEVGASGRRYSREYAIEHLLARYASPYEDKWETTDFFCQELASALYLLTYTLVQGDRVTAAQPSGEGRIPDGKLFFIKALLRRPVNLEAPERRRNLTAAPRCTSPMTTSTTRAISGSTSRARIVDGVRRERLDRAWGIQKKIPRRERA